MKNNDNESAKEAINFSSFCIILVVIFIGLFNGGLFKCLIGIINSIMRFVTY